MREGLLLWGGCSLGLPFRAEDGAHHIDEVSGILTQRPVEGARRLMVVDKLKEHELVAWELVVVGHPLFHVFHEFTDVVAAHRGVLGRLRSSTYCVEHLLDETDLRFLMLVQHDAQKCHRLPRATMVNEAPNTLHPISRGRSEGLSSLPIGLFESFAQRGHFSPVLAGEGHCRHQNLSSFGLLKRRAC
ncbi:hypothetical protein ACFPRL_04890 [Pseudoclavibacter helvolus]